MQLGVLPPSLTRVVSDVILDDDGGGGGDRFVPIRERLDVGGSVSGAASTLSSRSSSSRSSPLAPTQRQPPLSASSSSVSHIASSCFESESDAPALVDVAVFVSRTQSASPPSVSPPTTPASRHAHLLVDEVLVEIAERAAAAAAADAPID